MQKKYPALNTRKTKKLIIDFRKVKPRTNKTVFINEMMVESVNNVLSLGVLASDDLSWTQHDNSTTKTLINASSSSED